MSKKKETTSSGGKKKPLLFLLMLLIIAGVCAAAGYTWMELKELKSQVSNNAMDAPEKEEPEAEPVIPVYANLESFTVSLQPEDNDADRVLYIGLTLKMKDEAAKLALESHLPEVRSRLLMLLSQQTAGELTADKGKVKLVQQIKQVISEPLTGQNKIMITDVLFNAFILR